MISIWIAASGKYKEVLAARELYSLNCSLPAKQKFLSLIVLAKKSQFSHARECSQRPFVTPKKRCISTYVIALKKFIIEN